MSGQTVEESAGSTLEQRVLDYLKANPDLFLRHPALAADLMVPHPCGKAVSLLEYQLGVLRDQNQQLRRRLQELIATARANEELSGRLQRLTLALMECADAQAVFRRLDASLREDFGADQVSLRLFLAVPGVDPESLPAFVALDPEPESAWQLFGSVLAGAEPLCGRFKREQADYLFGVQVEAVRSGVLMPLGEPERFGLLGIGSHDERRFYAGMGTIFLRHLAEVTGRVLAPHLVANAGRAA